MIDSCDPHQIINTDADPTNLLIAADALEELGRADEARACRRLLVGDGYGDGDGAGYGAGYGDGAGYGYGAGYGDGDGAGYGAGYGDGAGYGVGAGYGYGDGDGYGYGVGDGYGDGLKAEISLIQESMIVHELEAGKEYMFPVGYGWMFVGRFLRPAGPFGAVFDRVRNLTRTGGTPWPELARGRGRDGATIVEWTGEGEEMPFANVICARAWQP